jgi:DNA-directed RNA polymerase subunit RPC12/RpoP
MPVFSMACPKCGAPATEYAEDKWQCLRCGVKFVFKDEGPPVINVHQIYETGETATPVLCCPSCGNRNVQLKRMVYETGTHTSILAGVAPALGSNGGWIGAGQSQTLLAKRCAPPGGAEVLWVITVITSVLAALCFLCFLGLPSLGAALFTAVFATVAFLSAGGALSASKRHRRDLRIWNETLICLACGHEFPRNLMVSPEHQGQQAEPFLENWLDTLDPNVLPKDQGEQAEKRPLGTGRPPPPPVPRRFPRAQPLPPEQQ